MILTVSSKLAIQSFVNKPFSRLIVLSSAAFTIFISAMLMVMYISFSKALTEIKESYSLIAFIENNQAPEKDKDIATEVSKIAGVKEVSVVTRENFMSQFSKFFPRLSKDISSLDSEVIPRYIKIRANSDAVDEIKRQLENLKTIQSVETNPERFKNLMSAIHTLKNYIILLLFGALSAVASIYLNHFKLDQIHRFQIIQTMKLLGARLSQMLLPFAIEGILEGLIAGILASLFIAFTGHLFEEQLSKLFFTLGYPFSSFPSSKVIVFSICISMLISFLSSLWSIGLSVIKK